MHARSSHRTPKDLAKPGNIVVETLFPVMFYTRPRFGSVYNLNTALTNAAPGCRERVQRLTSMSRVVRAKREEIAGSDWDPQGNWKK